MLAACRHPPPRLLYDPLFLACVPFPTLQVSLASDFMWNLNSREANASFGYDYVLRQCRLRGRIDTGALGHGALGHAVPEPCMLAWRA